MTGKFDLTKQAYIHVGDSTYPKNTLYNALCDIVHNPNRVTALVDVDGRSYSTVEIDEMLRSEEFRAHRKKLRAEGKERD